ncbi:MAG: Crp/Fnr family transcriptional regulator [Dehalococcoidia bacterium]|nr:Crp/Fnr family transcriptional regulator [Dehalococcoidia bacterium]
MTQTMAQEPTAGQMMREVPLLARLGDDDLQALGSRGRLRKFAPGTVIFYEGEPGDALHVVYDGRVRISTLSGGGAEATLALVGKGDFFGEFALLDGGLRSATATAVVSTTTFVVTRDDFVTWISEHPRAALALLETLSLRLRRTDEAFTDLSFLELPQRLAKKLVALAGTGHGRKPGRIEITQSELGSMLSVSRESVNKQLNQFQRDGWIRLSRGAVTVIDMEALRNFS